MGSDPPGDAAQRESGHGLLDPELLRNAFVVYGAMARRDWRKVSIEDAALSAVLPLRDNEVAFLDLLLDRGEVDGSILTGDRGLADRIRAQPLLPRWKARQVRQHRGLP